MNFIQEKNNKYFNLPLRGKIKKDFSLAPLTWFKVGGKAEILFEPYDKKDLIELLRGLKKDIPLYVLGAGSNLLIRDGGISGIVIKLGKKFCNLNINNNLEVTVGAGYNCIKLARKLSTLGIGGLEFYSGIPGTVGGAIKMNSGAYQFETSDRLLEVIALDRNGNTVRLTPKDYKMSYRKSSFSKSYILLEGIYKCELTSKEKSLDKISKFQKQRTLTQPIKKKTSGSTFKNTKNKKAWELIKGSGANLLKVGGAKVSKLHANFLINNGSSTSADLENLGEEIRNKVRQHFGIQLEWEIKIIGEKKQYKRYFNV